ncbi:MAG: hypothetical protein H7Y22_09970 [Gemmatimonadaceae bacterium]|nr:hypothetical protein [Gloeobacterales cyanobacterium ES-bin-141]
MATNHSNIERQAVQGERGLDWRVASPSEVLAASKVKLERYSRESGTLPSDSRTAAAEVKQ